jgi:hypothetical protein
MLAWHRSIKELLNKSFDSLKTNGEELIPFVLSLSKHERNPRSIKELLNKSFDRLRTNGGELIPFVLSLSKHERNPLKSEVP